MAPYTALVVLSAWSALPPYLGPALALELDVSSTVEAVDHLVPGVVALAGSSLAWVLARRGQVDSTIALGALGVAALGGLWETASHVPLVLDAGDSDAPWGAVLLHATVGPPVLVLSVWLMMRAPVAEDAG